jgi:cob(I)alamin adenosyltransferase
MSNKIYTKTGDTGTTSLYGGTKVSKGHERIEAYGTVDELNSHIGMVRDLLSTTASLAGQAILLGVVQNRLFDIGSTLALDPDAAKQPWVPELRQDDIKTLEKAIDEMEELLPPLKNFILPGGHPTVSAIHIARCVCRRAERAVVRQGATEPLPYLNRLSDYLFVLARFTAHDLGTPEVPWTPRAQK